MSVYADGGDLDEDERIAIIGHHAVCLRQLVGFITDDTPGKADRYIAKLRDRYPGIVVLKRFNGPVKGTVSVKVGPPPLNQN